RDFHVTGVQTCALPIYHGGDPATQRRRGFPRSALRSVGLPGPLGAHAPAPQAIARATSRGRGLARLTRGRDTPPSRTRSATQTKIGRASCRARVKVWSV